MSRFTVETIAAAIAAAAAQLRAEGNQTAATIAETLLVPNAEKIAKDALRIAATGQA